MRSLLSGTLALTTALACPALAQTPPAGAEATPAEPVAKPAKPEKKLTAQEQAAEYFKEGRAFFKAKDYRAAVDKFQAAYNLDPVPILLYNMARAAEEMGDSEKAIGHYRSYLQRLGDKATDRAEVERRIRVMEKTVIAARRARIRIAGLPPNAAITVDGAPVVLEDGLVRADPGQRVVQVMPADGTPWSKTLELSTGEYVEVVFGHVETPEPPPGPSATAIAGWSALGAGALFGVLGAVFYADASSASDDWQKTVDLLELTSDPDAQVALVAQLEEAADTADSSGTAAYVLWGLGGVALAAGGTLLYLEYAHEDGTETEAALVPLPGGVGITGRF